MDINKERILAKLTPFITMGIFLVIIIVFGIISFYVLVFGALIGLILFAFTYLRKLFFPKKKQTVKTHARIGQTYEHDDFKK